MPYDLFVSYSRRDNAGGRVSELVQRIADDYREFSGEDLSCFFDKNAIVGMDDWRHKILDGLKESQLFLLVLSPEYLKSPYCGWEVVEYLKYELARAVSGEGVAPIYFATVPGLDEPGFEEQAAAWFGRVRRRQHFDLRAWFEAGRQALERQDVQTRLDDLKRSLHTRLSRLRRIASAPGNLPAHNPRFVGRESEMRRLHEAAGLGQLGVISAVHGIGGLGKTALAIQYAFAYADFYPGGRWLIGCAGMSNLAAAIRTLDSDLGVTFTDEEKLDVTRAAKRILENLHERAERGATARAGEPNAPQPRVLLILDNIDDARLLHPPHTDLLSGRTWLHVLTTTRLGPSELSPDDVRHRLLAVDELPPDDALQLIASYQTEGRFANGDERAAAREIVTLLRGFTLAVEVVAVHLAERGGRLTCAALRDRLVAEGLTGLENIAGTTTGGVPHGERLVTLTLAPTLATLTPPESLVLVLAALLPPDHVPLPWLRTVASATFPELGQDAPAGYDDPWLTLVNRLISLRLLQVVEFAADERTLRLCRVHRLVQEVVKRIQPDDLATRERALLDHIRGRAKFLRDGWIRHEHRTELAPLTACADQWLEREGDDGPWLASVVAGPLLRLGNFSAAERLNRRAVERTRPDNPTYATRLNKLALLLKATNRLTEAEPLFRRAVTLFETSLGSGHPNAATALNNLGELLCATNRLAEAEPLLRRALAIREGSLGKDHSSVAIPLSSLALLLRASNRLAEAEPMYRRALAIWEKSLGQDHPDVATALNNLGELLCATNRLAEAEPMYRRALAISEKSYGPDHPDVAQRLNNLASLLEATNRLAEAEPLYRRALAIWEKSLGQDHPDVAIALNNLAELLRATNRVGEAEPLYRRALAILEGSYGPDHPQVATAINNLAELLRATNRLREAEPLYRRALAIWEKSLGQDHPNVAAAIGNLALLLQTTNRLREAEPLYRRALAILLQFTRATGHEHPTLRVAINNYAGLLAALDNSPQQVRARLDEIGRPFGTSFGSAAPIASAPASAEEHFQRGEECRVREEWDQAIAHFSAAISLNPKFADAYFKRGNIKLRLSRHGEAIADYTEAIRLDPKNAKYLNNRGRAYFETKQYDRAIADHDAALRTDPRFAVSYFNRGLARKAKGDRDGALADFAKCVDLEPSNTTYRDQLDAAKVPRAIPSTRPILEVGKASPGPSGGIPHPTADANRAAQLNLEYQQALAQWKALPLWKRLGTKRPERPTGI